MADVIPGDWVSVRKLAEQEGGGNVYPLLIGTDTMQDANGELYVSPAEADRVRRVVKAAAAGQPEDLPRQADIVP